MCNCQSSLCNWRCPKNIHRGLSYLLAFNSEDRRPIWRSQPRLDDEVGIRAYSHLFSPIFLGYSGSFHCHCHCHWLTDFVFVDQTSRLDLHCLSFYLSLHSSGQGAAQCEVVWTVAIGIVHHTTYLRNYDFLFTKELRRQRDKVSFSVGKSKAFHYGLIAIPGFWISRRNWGKVWQQRSTGWAWQWVMAVLFAREARQCQYLGLVPRSHPLKMKVSQLYIHNRINSIVQGGSAWWWKRVWEGSKSEFQISFESPNSESW